MECWLRQYKKEKEKLISEHPNLREENIGPYIIHYWDLYTYCVEFGIILLFLLGFIFPGHLNQMAPFFYALILIDLIARNNQQKRYKECPEHD